MAGSRSVTATMFQQIPQFLLMIAATGMVLSVIAFVISIFSLPASIPVIRLTEKLAIPVHVLLATAALAVMTRLGMLSGLERSMGGLPIPWFLPW